MSYPRRNLTPDQWVGVFAFVLCVAALAVSFERGRTGHGDDRTPRHEPTSAPALETIGGEIMWTACDTCGERHSPAMVNTNSPWATGGCAGGQGDERRAITCDQSQR